MTRSITAILLIIWWASIYAQLETVHRPDGTIWKNDKDSRGALQNGWMRYEYDTSGRLIREVEFASIGNDTYKLREIEHVNGQELVVYSRSWFAHAYLNLSMSASK